MRLAPLRSHAEDEEIESHDHPTAATNGTVKSVRILMKKRAVSVQIGKMASTVKSLVLGPPRIPTPRGSVRTAITITTLPNFVLCQSTADSARRPSVGTPTMIAPRESKVYVVKIVAKEAIKKRTTPGLRSAREVIPRRKTTKKHAEPIPSTKRTPTNAGQALRLMKKTPMKTERSFKRTFGPSSRTKSRWTRRSSARKQGNVAV